jgi:hypothetical protein
VWMTLIVRMTSAALPHVSAGRTCGRACDRRGLALCSVVVV